MSQRKYTIDLLTETGILGCRSTDTPIEFNCKLGNSNDQVPVDKEQYQHLVGKLIYLSHTHPDISFVVSVVSQFMQAPYEKHMKAVNRILRYLKITPGKGSCLEKQAERPLRHIPTRIGLDLLLTKSLPLVIVPLFRAILLLGGVRSKVLWSGAVLRPNTEL